MVTATTTLGERGLVRLPASIREAAELERGQELVMIAEGLGRVTLTTRETIQAEVWAAAPDISEPDSLQHIRDYRAADRARADERFARTVHPEPEHDPNPAGDALLDSLGLGGDV